MKLLIVLSCLLLVGCAPKGETKAVEEIKPINHRIKFIEVNHNSNYLTTHAIFVDTKTNKTYIRFYHGGVIELTE